MLGKRGNLSRRLFKIVQPFSTLCLPFSRTDTLKRACGIAELLLTHHEVAEVQLFGSVAKYGRGRNIDLIAIVDYDSAFKFLSLVADGTYAKATQEKCVFPTVTERLLVAREVLGFSTEVVLPLLGENIVDGRPLNLFLLPRHWEHDDFTKYELEHSLDPEDLKYLSGVPKDARRYDPQKGMFELSAFEVYFGRLLPKKRAKVQKPWRQIQEEAAESI